MKNEPILAPLKALAKSSWTIKTEHLLSTNRFVQIDILVNTVVKAALLLITKKEKVPSYQALIRSNPTLKLIIDAGDRHYYTTFRNGGLITSENEKFEIKSPITNIFKALYNRVSGRNGKFSFEIMIYDDLAKYFLKEIATQLLVHPEINEYQHWKRISNLFVNEWRLPENWQTKIPKSYLKKEANHFSSFATNKTLSQLADFGPTRKRNRPNLQAYLKLIEYTNGLLTYKRLTELTDGNEYISFKEGRYFDLSLLELLGAKEWLTLVDKLHYPIVQDHAFIFIRSIGFYKRLIRQLVSPTFNTETPKSALLFIILKNYLEAIFNVGYELSNYLSGRAFSDHPDLARIQSSAVKIKARWFEKILPASFQNIGTALLLKGKKNDDLCLLFIEWFAQQLPNEHPQFSQQMRVESVKVMDVVFKQLIGSDLTISELIISRVPTEIYNWKYFDLLMATEFAEKNTNRICERIIKLHEEYLKSPNFKWNNPNSFNNYFINQAYHFSILILTCTNPLIYWEDLYKEFRIYHEGWDYNVDSDYLQFRKECYVLCAGIGIAYHLGVKKRNGEAQNLIRPILNRILSQSRQNKRYSQFYLTPLCFVLVYYEKFEPSQLSDFVLTLIKKIDGVKLLLNVCSDLITSKVGFLLSADAKKSLKTRIESEFFVIADQPDLMSIREQKQAYTTLKDKLFKVLEE